MKSPRKSFTKAKRPVKSGARAKPGAKEAKPSKVRKGEKVAAGALKALVSGAVAQNGPLPALHDLSDRWFQAWLEKDDTTVERLAAEDYLYIGPSGLIFDRQAILNIVRSPSYRLDHGQRTEVVFRAVGREAAVVRHRYQGAGTFEGTSFTDDHRCVMVWEKLAGQWRLVMEQCSFSSEKNLNSKGTSHE